jgi:hypothetical protein
MPNTRNWSRRSVRLQLTHALALGLAAAVACGTQAGRSGFTGSSISGPDDGGTGGIVAVNDATFGALPDGGSPGLSDAGSSGFAGPLAGPFTDFPPDAILDTPAVGDAGAVDAGPPANAAQLFGPTSQGAASGGPCLVEPEVGTLYPNNWLRPRFVWNADPSDNLFELRLHVQNQTNDLVVYTTATQWTMPSAMWGSLSSHSQDVPMTVSVRSGQFGAGALTNEATGSTGAIGIAPVGAPGSIVYWAIVDGQSGSGVLKGFAIGDESVVSVLTGPEVQVNPAPQGNRACIGCHASTPDGLNLGFSSEWSNYSNSLATIGQDAGAAGGAPSFLTPDAITAVTSLNGVPAFSRAHWAAGDRVELLSDTGDLHWVNLEASGTQVKGVVARTSADAGDMRAASTPSWSHDGSTIVYTSLPASGVVNGRPDNGAMDLYSVPYAGGAGGIATPVSGASLPNVQEFYPSISPDDAYVVFDTVSGTQGTYANPADEVSIVPMGGGTATRLDANDPPSCISGNSSPGVTNSWPKWSPSAQRVPVLGSTYYWVVFSSTRYHAGDSSHHTNPQLYITPVVVDDSGQITTYHSLYLWNQPVTEDNHTPAWDVFQIPAVPNGPPR